MSRVKEIEGQVKSLNSEELKAFREWWTEFDAEIWDRQLEADATNGKLLSMADKALREHKAGHSTKL